MDAITSCRDSECFSLQITDVGAGKQDATHTPSAAFEPSMTYGQFVGMDAQLTKVLWNAVKIAKAIRARAAGVDEFVAALSLDDLLVAELHEKGVTLKYFFRPSRED